MSARSLNKVLLIGNLTRDVELKYTAQGTAVATFGLATNRSWVGPDGQRQEDATFHRIVAWSKLAEICNQLLFKGRKVFIEGRLQTRKWTSQDGQEREVTEIVAENMMVLDNRQQDVSADVDDVVVADEHAGGDDVIDVNSGEEKADDAKSDKKEESAKDSDSKDSEKKTTKDTKKKEEKANEEVVEIDDIPF